MRDAAAVREQAVLDAAGSGLLKESTARTAAAHLEALGGVYVATPSASPEWSATASEPVPQHALEDAVETCLAVLDVLETNRTLVNLSPFGEPQLGRRGLDRSAGGAVSSPDEEKAFLWLLNLSDGTSSLLDVADRSGIPYPVVRGAAERLEQADLLGATG